jgi:hypothetical protein
MDVAYPTLLHEIQKKKCFEPCKMSCPWFSLQFSSSMFLFIIQEVDLDLISYSVNFVHSTVLGYRSFSFTVEGTSRKEVTSKAFTSTKVKLDRRRPCGAELLRRICQ